MKPSQPVVELTRRAMTSLAIHLFFKIKRNDLVGIEVDDRAATRARDRIGDAQLELVAIALFELPEERLGEAVLEDDVQVEPQPRADLVLLPIAELRERKSAPAFRQTGDSPIMQIGAVVHPFTEVAEAHVTTEVVPDELSERLGRAAEILQLTRQARLVHGEQLGLMLDRDQLIREGHDTGL